VIKWPLCKLGVYKWLVSSVMSMYMGARTVVRIVHANSNNSEVKNGTHQDSALSPLLFVIREFRKFKDALPWELLYADDLVIKQKAKKN